VLGKLYDQVTQAYEDICSEVLADEEIELDPDLLVEGRENFMVDARKQVCSFFFIFPSLLKAQTV